MKNTGSSADNKQDGNTLSATGIPRHIRLLFDLDSNGKVLKSKSVLSVRTINNFGAAAVDGDREIHIIRRCDFEITDHVSA